MGAFGASFSSGADALAIVSIGMLVNLATGNVLSVLLMAGWGAVALSTACFGLRASWCVTRSATVSSGSSASW